ncbi:lipoprotein LpqH [Mycobacterium sp. 663a-19]|uniref:lipoprotein LpqH n=1 Tax=Mycobacterium sp. 663a-19 TaxID=2986148 RepID=UPI003B6324A2
MLNRITAVAVALSVAVLGACTPRTQTPAGGTASVTVNGNDAKFQIVKCTQVEWFRTIDIGGNFSGATVSVDERAEPVAVKSVHIRNLSGFTGMYSQGGEGDANSSLSGGKFTITGTANGYKADKPNEPATATFKIVVTC